VLEDIADAIECKRSDVRLTAEDSLELLKRVLEKCCGPESQRLPAVRVDSFITLLREIDQLAASLAKDLETAFRRVRTVSG
jgi:hypothetical protein